MAGMIRLRPSAILITREEAKAVDSARFPSLATPPADFLPWDHNITVRRQKQKGKQKATSITDAATNTLNIFADDDGYNGNTEGEGSLNETSLGLTDVPRHRDVLLGFNILDESGSDEESEQQSSGSSTPGVSEDNILGPSTGNAWMPSLVDGPSSVDISDFSESGVLQDITDEDLIDINYLADAEPDFPEGSDQDDSDEYGPLPTNIFSITQVDGQDELNCAVASTHLDSFSDPPSFRLIDDTLPDFPQATSDVFAYPESPQGLSQEFHPLLDGVSRSSSTVSALPSSDYRLLSSSIVIDVNNSPNGITHQLSGPVEVQHIINNSPNQTYEGHTLLPPVWPEPFLEGVESRGGGTVRHLRQSSMLSLSGGSGDDTGRAEIVRFQEGQEESAEKRHDVASISIR